MRIVISNTAGIPIYEQIKKQIKAAILSGELQDNELLPSLRQLAKELKISVLTVTRVYTELEQEGYVTNVQGKGCYVLPKGNELIREQFLRRIEEDFSSAIASARAISLSREELRQMFEIMLNEEF